MTRDEHLYTIAAEECAELAQRFSKANRFGGDEIQPGQDLSNRQRILYEFADLIAMMEMLGFFPFGLRTGPNDALRPEIDAKKAKVEKYLAYSAECGTVSRPVRHARSCPAYGNYQPPYEECDCGHDE